MENNTANNRFFYFQTIRKEFSIIRNDFAVIFSFFVISIAVALLYTYVYSKEVLQDLPIVVVDKDATAESRILIRMIDDTEQINVVHKVADFSEALELFKREKVRAIVTIPLHFSEELFHNNQPVVSLYCDASYILYYKQIYKGVKMATSYLNAGVNTQKLIAEGLSETQALGEVQAVKPVTVALYNPNSGYGIFVMPIIYLVIIQTTMLMGIGLLGGTARENRNVDTLQTRGRRITLILGKATSYTIIGLFVLFIISCVVQPLFGMHQRGNILGYFIFLFPYILGISFLGLFLVRFFKYREDAVMTIVLTSIPAVLLSGVSWPTEKIPSLLLYLAKLIPSTGAGKGFIALSQAGATLGQVIDIWLQMWCLCFLYFVLALLSRKNI